MKCGGGGGDGDCDNGGGCGGGGSEVDLGKCCWLGGVQCNHLHH